jgi:hypothetical protein
MPALTNVSAAEEPAGPDPTTATRSDKDTFSKSLKSYGKHRITLVLAI